MDNESGCVMKQQTASDNELCISSGFKYPRRLCTQKTEKYVDIYGQRPALSPVRTRSQTLENENIENVKPQNFDYSRKNDLNEEGPFPPDSPININVSTSTPIRNRHSHRLSYDETYEDESYLDRSRSRLGSPSSSFSLDGSRMSTGSERYHRRSRHRHPDYDPTIEIRQAKERHSKYRSGKWSDTSDLFDAVMEDKERYKEKLEKRARDRGMVDDQGNPEVDMEEDDEVLARRQRDIDNGKTTTEYEGYVKGVPKPLRKIHQPRTPNKFIKYSRRQWDGLVRSWRRQLHTWDSDTGAGDSISSFSSAWDTPSPRSERDHSIRSNRGRRSGVNSRRSSMKVDRRSTRRSPTKAVRFPMNTSSSNHGAGHVIQDDEDTMMGFPGQNECVPTLSSTPTIRKKRASGQANSNGPEPEALSTGLTSDVGDVILNVRGTPTKRKTTTENCTDNEKEENGGTPRKRARQQMTNSEDQSFAQIVQMIPPRTSGSPYKLRSQIRRAPSVSEEDSNSVGLPQSSDQRLSYAHAARGPVRKLEFMDRD